MKSLYLIDANSPFFSVLPENEEYNWSKIPFSKLEENDTIPEDVLLKITDNFSLYCEKINKIGYNSITIDDLAHLITHNFYNPKLIKKLDSYKKLYNQIFKIANSFNLDIYINTDIMFFSTDIHKYCNGDKYLIYKVLIRSINKLFTNYPHVKGVIFRIGEGDGLDVDGDFISQLTIKTPTQLRQLIKKLLPLFENSDKKLIIRTWSLGAFPIGDLMWNQKTFESVFDQFDSDNLVISMKFGESDFFRYMNFNKIFFESNHQKIIELQARREYEGFGEFPSFIGRDYKKYTRYISTCQNVIGLMVWCQTGGWSHFTKLTFLKNSSIWNEINTYCALKIFKNELSIEDSITNFMNEYFPYKDPQKMIKLLTLSEKLVKQLWYIPEFSNKRLYFRRNRVPSILWIFWDNILINHTLRKIIRRFVHERREAIQDGYRHLKKIKDMKKLAKELSLNLNEFDYMYDTYKIIAISREYYLGSWNPKFIKKFRDEITQYNEKYPNGFHILYDFKPVHLKKWLIKTIFKLSLRNHPHYRIIDKILFLKFASLIYPLFYLWEKKRVPEFAKEQAMGISTLFK